jgi:hypothetical protein
MTEDARAANHPLGGDACLDRIGCERIVIRTGDARRGGIAMSSRCLATLGCVLLAAVAPLGSGRAVAAERHEEGCVYNREVHPPASEICQGETRKRCENGAWVDVGRCDRPALEPPRSEGGDAVEEPAPAPVPPPRR